MRKMKSLYLVVGVSPLFFKLSCTSLLGYKIMVYNQHFKDINRIESARRHAARSKDKLCLIDLCFCYTYRATDIIGSIYVRTYCII